MGRMGYRRIVLWTALVIAIAVVSVEGGLRARLALRDPHQWDDDGLFRYRPNTQVGLTPDLTTNNHGFFGPDLDTPSDPAACRIILLGSSSIASPDLPALVTDILKKHFPERIVEVNTAGLPRYTSHHNRLLFERYIVSLEPDVVAIYLGLNNNVYNTNPDDTEEPPLGLWNWRDARRSVAVDMLAYHGYHKRFAVTPDFEHYPGAERFAADVAAIVKHAREHGIAVVLLREALAWPTDDPILTQTIRQAEAPMRHFWGSLDAALRGAEATNTALDSLAAEYGLSVVEVAPYIPRDSLHFRDLCHFTPVGMERFSQVAADAMAAYCR